jgi:CRP-like cAMP-binding protein
MSTSLREVRLDAGEYLCRQGEPGDSLFLIESASSPPQPFVAF